MVSGDATCVPIFVVFSVCLSILPVYSFALLALTGLLADWVSSRK